MSSSNEEVIVVEEADRQFAFIQALKKIDFSKVPDLLPFRDEDDDESGDDGNENETEENDDNVEIHELTETEDEIDRTKLTSASSTIRSQLFLIDEERLAETPKSIRSEERAIDIINRKIYRLDSLFKSFDAIKQDQSLEDDEIKQEKLIILESLDSDRLIKSKKRIDLFAGIYSMKAILYRDTKTDLPNISWADTKETNSDKPKLVELYQFSQYDKNPKISLPHGVSLTRVLKKVLGSILSLNQQASYRKFVHKIFLSKPSKYIVHDTFWWCFLERYQKLAPIQEQYFDRVAKNYARLVFTPVEPLHHRDKFLTSLPNLLAMSVYTIFGECFPQSHMTHFNNDSFKEFISSVASHWLVGIKPVAPSLFTASWNFEVLDPPTSVFAQQVLDKNNENNVVNEIEKLGNAYFQRSSTNYRKKSPYFSLLDGADESGASDNTVFSHRRRDALLPKDIDEIVKKSSASSILANRIFRSAKKTESHPVGSGAEFEECLFNLLGHSPLIDYYLYTQHARKINNVEILIQHRNLLKLPPMNATTYKDLIMLQNKQLKKREKTFKEFEAKSRSDYEKLEKSNVASMRAYAKDREQLLSNVKEVKVLGELIMMNHQKDTIAVGSNLEKAVKKAFRKSRTKPKYVFTN